MLDVRRMRVLREVAVRGSFSAAAESLSFTQSAVSQQIAALEREAGTVLVRRSARGVRLTEAGEALVRHAEAILTRLAEAEAELEAIAGLRGGRLRLASFEAAAAALRPLAMPADHPLARKRNLRLADLADDPWVAGTHDCECNRLINRACAVAGFEPRIAFETDDYTAMQGFVAAGVGVSLIAELGLTTVRDDVVVRSLGRETPVREVYAGTLAEGYRSPATAAMLAMLEEVAARHAARRPRLALAG